MGMLIEEESLFNLCFCFICFVLFFVFSLLRKGVAGSLSLYCMYLVVLMKDGDRIGWGWKLIRTVDVPFHISLSL